MADLLFHVEVSDDSDPKAIAAAILTDLQEEDGVIEARQLNGCYALAVSEGNSTHLFGPFVSKDSAEDFGEDTIVTEAFHHPVLLDDPSVVEEMFGSQV